MSDEKRDVARQVAFMAWPVFDEHDWRYWDSDKTPTVGKLLQMVQGMLDAAAEDDDAVSIRSGRFRLDRDPDEGTQVSLELATFYEGDDAG